MTLSRWGAIFGLTEKLSRPVHNVWQVQNKLALIARAIAISESVTQNHEQMAEKIIEFFSNPFSKKERDGDSKGTVEAEKERWKSMAESHAKNPSVQPGEGSALPRQSSLPAPATPRSASQQSPIPAQQQLAATSSPAGSMADRQHFGAEECLKKLHNLCIALRATSPSDIRAFPFVNDAQRHVQLLKEMTDSMAPQERAPWQM
eukprot:gene10033-7923_t